MILDGLLEINVPHEMPSSLHEVLEDIKRMALASLRKIGASSMLAVLMLGSMPGNAQAAISMTNIPTEIVIDNYRERPEIITSVSAYPHHCRIYEMMEVLRTLDDNWDGAGGLRISENAISLAERFIDKLSEKVLTYCSLFPAANSGVYLQGRFKKGSLIVTFSNEEAITYVLKGHGIDRLSAKAVPLEKDTVYKLNSIITEKLIG